MSSFINFKTKYYSFFTNSMNAKKLYTNPDLSVAEEEQDPEFYSFVLENDEVAN